MDLFGLNRFVDGPEREPSRGPARWLQALWDNLGGLLGGNVLTFLGFLPLALGASLGLVYENFWITLLSGALGGAVAGVFWPPMLALSLQAFRGGTRGWLRRWRRAAVRSPLQAAGMGAVLGLLSGALAMTGTLAGQLLSNGAAAPLPVWVALALDFFLLSLAAVLVFPVLGLREKGRKIEVRDLLGLLTAAPGRVCGAAAGTLLWCALGAALFPVSVPFALALGFWPPALFTAQLLLPSLEARFLLESGAEAAGEGLTARQRGEIWWRRRWPVVVTLTACTGLLLWGGSQLFSSREPDVQIAVVRAQPLPDGVRGALEDSLAALVGDRNGDGQARAQVNDYTVSFDGSAQNADRQSAGVTLLVSDIAAGDSALYLVEDKAGFLTWYGDKVDGDRAAPWADWPALSGLDAGTYSALEDIHTDVPGRELLDPLTVLPGLAADRELLDLLLKLN